MKEAIITKKKVIDMKVPIVKLGFKSGIKKEDRVKITGAYETNKVLRRLFNGQLEHIESMWILSVNRHNEVIGAFEVSRGGVSGTVCDPKVVFQFAILSNASGIVLSHNHPSGNLSASQADIALTKKIKDGARLLELELLDHIIITQGGYYSFADEGLI